MIDGEPNTVRPDPGTANDARPPITFLCLARSRRRSSSSSVHASSNDRIPCQHPSATRSRARRRQSLLSHNSRHQNHPCSIHAIRRCPASAPSPPSIFPIRSHSAITVSLGSSWRSKRSPKSQRPPTSDSVRPTPSRFAHPQPATHLHCSQHGDPPSQHASGRKTPSHHQQDMIFTIDPNGVDPNLDQHRRGSDRFLLKLHRAVHSAEVTSKFARSIAVRHHLHQ
ncbi:hypothetical protein ACLOJK_034312 [Asimina triloba]